MYNISKLALNIIAVNNRLSKHSCNIIDKVKGYLKKQSSERIIYELEQNLRLLGGAEVQRGPFAGTLLPVTDITNIKRLLPQILGSYESELHRVLTDLCTKDYQQIINVGAGWGYYCVGLARRFPDVYVHAFEMDETRRALCRQTAELNEVSDQLELFGMCTPSNLNNVIIGGRGLVIIDCEGFERELLSLEMVDNLAHCDLLVEIHDYHTQGPTTGEILCDRFRDTHELTSINFQPKEPDDYIELEGLDRFWGEHLLNEGRIYSRGWLCLRSRQNEKLCQI